MVPLTSLDPLINFWPGALPFYLSLWVYVPLVPALLVDRRDLGVHAAGAAALSIIGLGLFHLFPTAVPPSDIDWSRHAGLAFLKTADASGNACPSLHVAFAVFTAGWLGYRLRQLGAGRLTLSLNGIWCGAILYSTVAIRQHVVLDVLAGAALGGLVAGASLRWRRRACTPSVGMAAVQRN